MIKINKYRTVAALYPHTSFECEVNVDGRIIYCNFDVGTGVFLDPADYENAEWWQYDVSLTSTPDVECCVSLPDDTLQEIYRSMVVIWNENPVWDDTSEWHTVNRDCTKQMGIPSGMPITVNMLYVLMDKTRHEHWAFSVWDMSGNKQYAFVNEVYALENVPGVVLNAIVKKYVVGYGTLNVFIDDIGDFESL